MYSHETVAIAEVLYADFLTSLIVMCSCLHRMQYCIFALCTMLSGVNVLRQSYEANNFGITLMSPKWNACNFFLSDKSYSW